MSQEMQGLFKRTNVKLPGTLDLKHLQKQGSILM